VLETSHGELWMGGASALARLEGDHLRIIIPRMDSPTGPSSSCVKQGWKLVVGGRGKLHEFDGRKWSRLKDDLGNARSIGDGVHRRKNSALVTNDVEDGLPSRVAHRVVFADSRGRFWAGTTSGLSLYHPNADADPPRTPIQDRNGRRTAPDRSIRLLSSGVDKWQYTPAGRCFPTA
jgi:hypothetical protein